MGALMSDKDKKKKRKKLTSPGAHVRKGKRAVPPREKPVDDEDDDDVTFSREDMTKLLGIDVFADDSGDEEPKDRKR
jgi:hypothetical protein